MFQDACVPSAFFQRLLQVFPSVLFPPLEGFASKLRELNLQHLLMEWLTFKFFGTRYSNRSSKKCRA